MIRILFKKHNLSEGRGFTLVEMLVSVALFSIVMIIMLGAVLAVVDVNRKSQSLTTVMNNLNFALESITRSIKTGELQTINGSFTAISLVDQDGQNIRYAFNTNGEGVGQITRQVNSGDLVPITSSQMDVENVIFRVFDGSNNRQPRVLMIIEGKVSVGTKVTSDFSIQTSVSQRELDLTNYVGS